MKSDNEVNTLDVGLKNNHTKGYLYLKFHVGVGVFILLIGAVMLYCTTYHEQGLHLVLGGSGLTFLGLAAILYSGDLPLYKKPLVVLILSGTLLYIANSVYTSIRDGHEATSEELTAIIKKAPCAADEFRKALDPDNTFNFRGISTKRGNEPLSLSEAEKLANKCQSVNPNTESERHAEEAVTRQREAIDKSGF